MLAIYDPCSHRIDLITRSTATENKKKVIKFEMVSINNTYKNYFSTYIQHTAIHICLATADRNIVRRVVPCKLHDACVKKNI